MIELLGEIDGTLIYCWRLTWREWLRALFTGHFHLYVSDSGCKVD